MQMQITLDQALDAAVDKLPFVRRRVMKNRLRSSRYRETLLAELVLKLHDDQDCCAMGMQPLMANASGATVFTFDPSQLAAFLELILKYLPLLLELLLPLFSSVLWMIFALSLSSSTTHAQERICINGVCYTVGQPTAAPPLMPVVNTAVKATTATARSIVEFTLPPYPHLPARNSQLATRSYSGGHWSYPGDLATHLARSHNVSAVGLTRDEQLNLHDSLHRPSSYQYSQRRSVVYRGPVRWLFRR